VIKFVLILHLCSLITGTCPSNQTFSYEFNDHYTCIKAGYQQSFISLNSLDPEEINNSKMVVRFECKELKIETT
jgi:hypothetical protein